MFGTNCRSEPGPSVLFGSIRAVFKPWERERAKAKNGRRALVRTMARMGVRSGKRAHQTTAITQVAV